VQFANEAAIVAHLRSGAQYWNSHFFWRDHIKTYYLQHEVDYWINKNYGDVVSTALQESLGAADAFAKEMTA
jgi:hypothetical protein